MRSQRLKKALRKTRPGMDRALRVIPGHVMPRLSRARWIPQDGIAESLFTKSSCEHRSPCERVLAACSCRGHGRPSMPFYLEFELPRNSSRRICVSDLSLREPCSQAAVSWSPADCNAGRVRVYLTQTSSCYVEPRSGKPTGKTLPLRPLDSVAKGLSPVRRMTQATGQMPLL